MNEFCLWVLRLGSALLSPENVQKRHLIRLCRSHETDRTRHVGEIPATEVRLSVFLDQAREGITIKSLVLLTRDRMSRNQRPRERVKTVPCLGNVPPFSIRYTRYFTFVIAHK